jgi:hypothetical protein
VRLGGSRAGFPRRLGGRDGPPRDSPATSGALAAGLALGVEGGRGIGADRQADGNRTLGGCLEPRVGLSTLVPRTCAGHQEGEAWGQQPSGWPFWLAKPGRTRQEPPRRWHGPRGVRRIPVEDADGRRAGAERRLLGVPSSRAAPGRRGRTPRPWRSPGLPSQVDAVHVPPQRTRRGRPPQAEGPQGESGSRLRGPPEALGPAEEAPGWPVLATLVGPEGGTDAEGLQADQEQHRTVAPGLRWSKNPAAIRPVRLAQPARMAAVALLTVGGWRVSAVRQRQVRLSLRAHTPHIPGKQGPTATPTAAVVFALLPPVRLGPCVVEHTTSRHGHGVQGQPLIVCAAVGSDPAWYQGATTGQKALPRTTPPLNVGS